MKKFDTLTKAEMQVMSILWELPHGGCIHEIISHYSGQAGGRDAHCAHP